MLMRRTLSGSKLKNQGVGHFVNDGDTGVGQRNIPPSMLNTIGRPSTTSRDPGKNKSPTRPFTISLSPPYIRCRRPPSVCPSLELGLSCIFYLLSVLSFLTSGTIVSMLFGVSNNPRRTADEFGRAQRAWLGSDMVVMLTAIFDMSPPAHS